MENKIQIFDKHHVRSVWDEEREKWWLSVLDIIAILADQSDYKKVRNYWKWLKNKLKEEGSNLFSNQQNNEVVSNTNQLKIEKEPVTNCYQLKLLEADGK
jgi:cell filamentation protein